MLNGLRIAHAELSGSVSQGKVKLILTSREYHVDEAKSALDYLVQKPNKGIGVLLKYRNDDSEVEIEKHKIISKPALGKVKERYPLPLLAVEVHPSKSSAQHSQAKDLYHIGDICDVSSATLKLLERKYQPQKITSDYKSVLSDPNVGLIVIGTRHDLHGKMVIEGLQAGKHVLVEKPLSMSTQELNTIRSSIRKMTSN